MSVNTGEAWLQSNHKRAMDLSVVALFAIPSALAGTAAAVALGVEMRRNPLFMQPRVGQSLEEPLYVPKLVTLIGPTDTQTSARGYDHDRASRVGRVVRKLHIDESPQLYSVLKGDMSIVGPRPIVQVDYEQVMDALSPQEQRAYTHARLLCKPGIVAPDTHVQHQTNGMTIMPNERAQRVIEYANTASLKVDVQLMRGSGRAVLEDFLPEQL